MGERAERRQRSHQAGSSGHNGAESARESWARQLMRPEWLIDLPPNLAAEWCGTLSCGLVLLEVQAFRKACCHLQPQGTCAHRRYVLPRPEGQRCLLIASGGVTTARMRSGVQMARFPSALPGGSRHTQVHVTRIQTSDHICGRHVSRASITRMS